MEVEIIEERKDFIKILFKDTTQTIPNYLRDRAWRDKNVVLAAYRKIHPLKKEFEFIIQTDGKKTAREVLIDTIKYCLKELKEFKSEYDKLFK